MKNGKSIFWVASSGHAQRLRCQGLGLQRTHCVRSEGGGRGGGGEGLAALSLDVKSLLLGSCWLLLQSTSQFSEGDRPLHARAEQRPLPRAAEMVGRARQSLCSSEDPLAAGRRARPLPTAPGATAAAPSGSLEILQSQDN